MKEYVSSILSAVMAGLLVGLVKKIGAVVVSHDKMQSMLEKSEKDIEALSAKVQDIHVDVVGIKVKTDELHRTVTSLEKTA